MILPRITQWLLKERLFSAFAFLAISLTLFHQIFPHTKSVYVMAWLGFFILPSIVFILLWLSKGILSAFRRKPAWIGYAAKIFFVISFLALNISIHTKQNQKTLQTLNTHFAPFVQAIESYKQSHGHYPETETELSMSVPRCPTGGEILYERTSPQQYTLSCPHPAPGDRYFYDAKEQKWGIHD